MRPFCSRPAAPCRFNSLSLIALCGGVLFAGCSHSTTTTAPTTQTTTSPAQTQLKPAGTGNTGKPPSSGGQPHKTGRPTEQALPKDSKGAFDARLKALSTQPITASNYGVQNFFEVQSVALQDLPKVAAKFDAATCRSYVTQLEALDVRVPSYATLLKQEEADRINQLSQRAKNPKNWQALIARLGRTPNEQAALNKMSVAQVKANIEKIYNAAIADSTKPYSPQQVTVSVDPYTRALASPSDMGRFLWTKFKTDRVLAIAALQQKLEKLENQSLTVAPQNDPFGTGPLKQKGAQIYSVGPDTKDDGGKSVPHPKFVQANDKGDILAPTL